MIIPLKFAATIVVGVTGVLAAVWVSPRAPLRPVPVSAEKKAAKVIRAYELSALEEDPDEEPTNLETGEVRVQLRVGGVPRPRESGAIGSSARVVRRAAAHVRAKIGLPKRTEANVLVARKLVTEYLEGLPDLRQLHYLQIVPLAVELAFIPTVYDIEARDIAASMAAVSRREAYGDTRYTIMPGWGPWGLFGRRRVVTTGPSA